MTTYKNYQTTHRLDTRDLLKFDVVLKGQTWRNIVYLLLAFPLGIAYFVFLITGVATGAGMAITLIGLPILVGVFLLATVFTHVERMLANGLLGTTYSAPPNTAADADFWGKLRAAFTNVHNWKGIGFLLLRFPAGIATFVTTITLLAITGGLLTAPFTYATGEIEIAFWTIDTFGEAIVAMALGVPFGLLSLHVLNGVAWLWKAFTGVMLDAGKPKRKNDEAFV